MTENKKIELFDKWYDENYDEWAEGEEGIALREELEQAFKGGVEVLEAENAELKSDNDARKFAMAMSEKVERQLRNERNTFLAQNEQYEKDLIDFNEKLTNAIEIVKKLKSLYFSPVVTKDDVKRQDEILAEVEQFLSEVKK